MLHQKSSLALRMLPVTTKVPGGPRDKLIGSYELHCLEIRELNLETGKACVLSRLTVQFPKLNHFSRYVSQTPLQVQ